MSGGDYTLEDTIYYAFTTRAFATGVPTALAGSPTLEIYENASTTPIVEGASKLVLTQNLNSINGFNMATITASAANGFETGKTYHLMIKTGTVGGTSVVGEVVHRFTLTASAAAVKTAFLPSVTAGGAGGLFIAGTNAATVVTTSFTTTFTGNLTGSVASVSGAVGSVTGNVGGNVTGSVGSVIGAVGSVTGAVGSVTGNVGGNVVGSVGSVVGAVGSVTGGVTVTTNNDKTGYLLAATGSAAMTESYAADGVAPTLGQFNYMIWSLLAERSRVDVTLTSGKLDGSAAMTFTLDSATVPTSQTRAT